MNEIVRQAEEEMWEQYCDEAAEVEEEEERYDFKEKQGKECCL